MKKLFIVILTFLLLPPSLSSQTVLKEKETTSFYASEIKYAEIISESDDVKIFHPISTYPVIVEKGENFTITFSSENFDEFHAFISTSYEPVVDEIELSVDDIWQDNARWHASITVPLSTPEELYNLTIVIEKDGTNFYCTEPRAVSVIDEFSDSFSFVHVSDFHIGDPRGMKVSIKETIGWKAAKRGIEEINLLHPDFVIISGDLVYGQLYPFEYSYEYKKCYEILQLFDVPTFLCPGNHDGYFKFREDGLAFWEEYFGPLYYSFNYGNYHFISVNSYDWPPYARRTFLFAPLNWGGYVSDEQLRWIEEDLRNNEANATFLFLHHNPLWDTKSDSLLGNEYYNRKELLSLIDEYDVDMVLDGHVHYDNVTIANGTVFVTTTTIASSLSKEDAYWGYRLIEIKDGEISSYNYKEPEYSIPSYHLNLTFENDYTAVVENDLEKNMVVQLKLVVPPGEYNVKNGKIIMKRESNGEAEIYVVATVEKKSEERIILTPLL